MPLKKSLSTVSLLTSAIAGIVGSGWLLGPLAAAKIAGPAAVLSWLIAGGLMMFIAYTFVMLARSLPMVGATVRYFQMSYGHFAGYSFSWIAWLAWVAVAPIETMALLQYSTNYLPNLMTQGAHPVLTHLGVGVAVGLLALISLLNSYGVQVYNKLNHIILAFKLCIPAMTIILLFSARFHIENFSTHSGFMPYGLHSLFASLPLAGVIYSFIGFNPAIQLAAEAKNPKRAVPIAIFGALTICIILYTLVQIAFIAALPNESLQQGWQQINFTGENGPFAGLLTSLGFIWFVKALYLDATVSPFGTALVQAMATSRLTFAMGQNGYFPKFLLKVNQQKAPIRAICLNLIVGCLFFLPFPSWQHMVGFLVSCLVLGYLVGPMSLMILSQTHPEYFPDQPKWQVQSLCLISLYVCSLIIYWTGWETLAKLGIVFVLGYLVLGLKLLCSKRSREILLPLHSIRGSWVLLYMLGIILISRYGSFGGGQNYFTFGVDFIVIALFVSAIYLLARCLAHFTEQPNLKTQLTEEDDEVSDEISYL